MNVIARLEYELAYYDSAVHRFNHYTTRTPLNRCYHSGPEWTWERWQWRGTPHSPKLQDCWNLTIRLFSVISRTLVGVCLTPLQRSSRCILQPQPTGQSIIFNSLVINLGGYWAYICNLLIDNIFVNNIFTVTYFRLRFSLNPLI